MGGWWLRCAVVLVMMTQALTYRAVFFAPYGTKSHKNFFMGVVKALVAEGNHVTLVTPFSSGKSEHNIREVVVPEGDISVFFPNAFLGNSMMAPLTVVSHSFSVCLDTLQTPQVQQLLQEEFDVALVSIFFVDCYLSAVHQLKVPHIYVSPLGLLGAQGDVIGNPSFPSFTVSPVLPFAYPLTFPQRVISAVAEALNNVLGRSILPHISDWTCRQRRLCGDDMPHVASIRLNTSLIIHNSVLALESPVRPYSPAVVHAGGIHCRPGKPLPQDLATWVDESGDDGFIFFSLGSAVKPTDMPEEYRRMLVSVFGSLRQRVLWKWNEPTMPDLPPNVRLGKWLPQQDILSHPKLRLFITHGGLLSTLESVYHGVPVVGLPVFGDQQTNMWRVQHQGWGLALTWHHLDHEHLRDAIYNVMHNKSMAEKVKQKSLVMRDAPRTPSDDVAYWVSYVVRHEGAHHLSPPIKHMPWWAVYNVDVWLAVAVLVVLAITGLVHIVVRLVRCTRRCLSSGVKAKRE